MGQNVLIVESREILRAGLRSVFASDPLITCVYEAATGEELKKHLAAYTPDLIVIHQSFITHNLHLPRGRFVIVASNPDKNVLFAAFSSGACGYLLENAPADLFLLTLRLMGGMFLLDPRVSSWLLESISGDILPSESNVVLTIREQEIFDVLSTDSLTNREVAEKLCITEATVKSHLSHIFRKLDIKRRPAKIISLSTNRHNEWGRRTS